MSILTMKRFFGSKSALSFLSFMMLVISGLKAQVIQNETVASGELISWYSTTTLTLGTGVAIESGGQCHAQGKEKVVLDDGFIAEEGSYVLIESKENLTPIVENGSMTTNQVKPVAVTLSGTDPENVPVKYVITQQPLHGVLSGQFPSLTYAPNDMGFTGIDEIRYKVSDGISFSLEASVKITIVAYNLPYASITPNIGPLTNNTSPSFTVGGTNVTQYKYSVDASAYSSAISVSQAISLSSLTDGVHTLKVLGLNAQSDEQTEDVATQFIWTQDTVPPITAANPPGATFARPVKIALTATESGNVYYTLDGSTPSVSGGTTLTSYLPLSGIPVSQSLEIRYFSVDEAGNTETTINSEIYTVENSSPVVLSAYPPNGALFPLPSSETQINVALLVSDDQNLLNQNEIKVFDDKGVDITSLTTLTNDTLSWTISPPADSNTVYAYRIYLEDGSALSSNYHYSFTVDHSEPKIFLSPPGGRFDESVSLSLSVSEESVVYYSLDGQDPMQGQGNTYTWNFSTNEISIAQNTLFKAYAVDNAGNTGAMVSTAFLFSELADAPENFTVAYDSQNNEVNLDWDGVSGAAGYHVYRAENLHDSLVLSQNANAGMLAPTEMRQNSTLVTASDYTDSNVLPGQKIWYVVSWVDSDNFESISTLPVMIEIPADTAAEDAAEAIERAVIWLKANQNANGSWGGDLENSILPTSAILGALKVVYPGNPARWQMDALFSLKGQSIDNNDFLARTIMVQSLYGLDTSFLTARLQTQAFLNGAFIEGFALTPFYNRDAVTTALSSLSLTMAQEEMVYTDSSLYYLSQSNDLKSDSGYWGFVPGRNENIYVSSVVHLLTGSPPSAYEWITTQQNVNGSFGTGLIDTAGVLKFLTLSPTQTQDAIDYIVGAQSPAGHWENDPYMTAICLDALASKTIGGN